MAMRIVSSRCMVQKGSMGLPTRACLSSSAPMSSSAGKNEVTENKPIKHKRESVRSFLSTVLGGNMEPARPGDKPINAADVKFPDATEYSTGEAKLMLLAFENGIMDPYCNMPAIKGDRGTKENPITIESFNNSRIVGCSCEKTQNFYRWTTVYKGEPKRCQCGHWMEIVDAPKFWEKIPKEDLVTIPFFKDLEDQGKLDDLLAGKSDIKVIDIPDD